MLLTMDGLMLLALLVWRCVEHERNRPETDLANANFLLSGACGTKFGVKSVQFALVHFMLRVDAIRPAIRSCGG
jgi:hypothetical protein